MIDSTGRSKPDTTAWHALETADAADRLHVDPGLGLTDDDAKERLSGCGQNLLDESPPRSPLLLFLDQFHDFMILILLLAAGIAGTVGELIDTAAILVIVLLNAMVGAVQSYRAQRAIHALKALAVPNALVLRDGVRQLIAAADLVPGDIVLLEAGSFVPADIRLLESAELHADESTLTGESVHTAKSTTVVAADAGVADRSDMVFSSTFITRGRGSGIAVATGMRTEIGGIARLLQDSVTVQTPIQRSLTGLGKQLAIAILLICGVVFGLGLTRGEPAMLMFLTAVSLAVAAIPEALPALVSITLAIGAREMARRNALVKRLPAVEALGSVTVICSDKTGTLTENRMQADICVLASQTLTLPVVQGSRSDEFDVLLLCAALNNDVTDGADGQPLGDPTEIALHELARTAGLDSAALNKTWPRIAELSFDSSRKRMTTLHRHQDRLFAFTKGAPETVLSLCTEVLHGATTTPIDLDAWRQQADDLAAQGYRVLAFACRRDAVRNDDGGIDEAAMTLLGLAGLLDPPRASARSSIEECRHAGIRPIMITGDHPGTAAAIARRLGLMNEHKRVVTGRELSAMTPAEFDATIASVNVFARVEPEQKLAIVAALQAKGEIVAMTGDGVNDAPALRNADIGVAMGRKGTDVAREAADMVLLDDDFSSIVSAVRHGRRIFANIRKFVRYTLTTNSSEIWVLLVAPFLGLPLPLLPIQILWVNLVTDGLPGLAFASEPEEADIMRRRPQMHSSRILGNGLWQYAIVVGVLIAAATLGLQSWATTAGIPHWQTMTFTVLVLAQLVNALSIRSEQRSLFTMNPLSNKPMVLALVTTVALHLLVIYLPWCNGIFKTQPLTLRELALCGVLALAVLLVVEAGKGFEWLLRRRPVQPHRS
ncbi:MAG: cation-translocating P-type ATPase [Gammaproteobacteria bacterium]|nr:cation-translocating P-type ATPase [Gammaproteobacteria bacterium]